MTTPKPEATMPAIAEALAEELERHVARLRKSVDGDKWANAAGSLAHCVLDNAPVILAALRADPTAGDRGSGARLTGTGSREPRPQVSASGFDPSREGGR